MKLFASLSLAVAVVVSASYAGAEELKSGLQPGESIGAFYVQKVGGVEDGVKVGDELCYRCRLGNRPVITVFTRSADKQVASLLKEIDKVVSDNENQKVASFVSVLGSDEKSAKSAAEKLAGSVKNIALVVPADDVKNGAKNMKISPDADITVLIYKEGKIVANHALKANQLDEKQVKSIIGDTGKILN